MCMLFKNLKKRRNFEKECKEARDKQQITDSKLLYHFEGKKVIYSTDFLRKNHTIIAGMTGRGEIIVDNYFMELPKNVQKAVLSHEVGHLVYAEAINRPASEQAIRTFEEETFADAYGLELGLTVEDIIECLISIKTCLYEKCGIRKNTELTKRILHFKNILRFSKNTK